MSNFPGPREEHLVIGYLRNAILLYDDDIDEARFQHEEAARLLRGYLPWSEEFAQLEQDMQQIWRNFTPQKTGSYKIIHIARGYSSLETRRWVDDKVQPPRQTVEEALSLFDALVAPFVQSIVEKVQSEQMEWDEQSEEVSYAAD